MSEQPRVAERMSPAAVREPVLRGPFGHKAVRVARVWGIDVGLDVSWFFVFALVSFALASKFGAEHEDWSPVGAWGTGIATSLVFFLSVLLHELGHSVTSNHLGLPVRSITLFIFGGLARLSGNPRSPREQFLIGAAGPAVSVVLGVVFLALAAVVPESPPLAGMLHAMLSWLGTINLFLAAFNLFPGHPLDGGHLLRAALWAITGRERWSTQVASVTGAVFAMALMMLGVVAVLVFGSPGGLWLALIGWFLMRASKGTATQAVLEERLGGVKAGDAMAASCPTIPADETVEALIADSILQKGLRHFCVEAGGELVGLVTLNEVKRVPGDERAMTRVDSIMVPTSHLATVAESETLWEALRRMDDLSVHQLPVTRGGRLIGLLTREQVLRVVRNQMEVGGQAA